MNTRAYWGKRVAADDERRRNQENVCIAKLKQQFEDCIAYCERRLADFYAQYASSGVVSSTDARKLLTSKERNEFRKHIATLRKTVRTETQDKLLKSLVARVRISRQEALLSLLKAKLNEITDRNVQTIDSALQQLTVDEQLHAAYNLSQGLGVAVDFDRFTDNQVKALVSTGYDGRSFSSKIWYNTETLSQTLSQLMPRMFLLGTDNRKLARELAKRMNSSLNVSARVVRTEGIYLANQADMNVYRNTGVEQYEYCATLDNRTSPICRSMDGRVFKLSEATVGVNLPPLHPYCRSTTIPVVDMSGLDAYRLAKDANGGYYKVPQSMSYTKWLDEYGGGD